MAYKKDEFDYNVDYSTLLREQIDSGAGWKDVYDTYNKRQSKIAGDPNLGKYAADDINREALDYIMAGQKAEAAPSPTFDTEGWEANNPKPTWESPVSDPIGQLVDKILNRDPFSYDPTTDPLFKQYESTYLREGDRAMRDTLDAAASGAGGMNSYALAAAQQANNYYAAQLGDKLPELYKLAYEMYMDEGERMKDDLSMLQDIEDTDYGRYMDREDMWRDDRDFARDEFWAGKEFDYKEDAAAKESQDAAYIRAMELISMGVAPNDELLEAAGMLEYKDALLGLMEPETGNSGYYGPSPEPENEPKAEGTLTSPRAQEIYDALKSGAKTPQQVGYLIQSALNNNRMSQDEAEIIMAAAGF